MNARVWLGLFVVVLTGVNIELPAGEMEKEAERFASGQVEVTPVEVAHEWFLPFVTNDRKSMRTVRAISPFGAKRSSYRRGHFHSGVDLVPKKKSKKHVTVYPVAAGAVCSIHLAEPHTTVVVKHRLPDGQIWYSAYKHLAEVFVDTGRQVNPDTPLGRLFTRKEAKKLRGPYDHLHFEMRRQFDDNGTASWLTMNREELDLRFVDPLPFLKKRLQPPRGLPAAKAERALRAARELIGVKYDFGGRLREPNDGIDCQGVLFYAAERIGRCGWKSFSTMPTESVPRKELGVRVPGLDPVGTTDLKTEYLMPGDIVLLVDAAQNPAEPAIGQLSGEPVWVWHTGIYSGAGNWIHADFFSGKVAEEKLIDFLQAHTFTGVFITRMSRGPRPKRCRRHTRMKLRW